jgi:hypothetical protein
VYLLFVSPFKTIELKSVTTRLYPYVDEFAMLSEMPAKRIALACRPATPALSEDEMVMR